MKKRNEPMRATAILAGLAALAAASPSVAQPVSLLDSFPIGSGTSILCTAQTAPEDAVLSDMFDRGYAVTCRDAVAPIGKLYALTLRGTDPEGRVAAARDNMACDAPAATQVEDLGTARTTDCRLGEGEVPYRGYALRRGGRLYIAEGLAGYDSALRLGLRALVLDRPVQGEVAAKQPAPALREASSVPEAAPSPQVAPARTAERAPASSPAPAYVPVPSASERTPASGTPPRPESELGDIVRDPSFNVYVGKDDSIIRRVSGRVEFVIPEEDRTEGGLESGRLTFSVELKDVNGDQEIEAPTRARPLSALTESLGSDALGLGGGGDDATPVVPADPNPPNAGTPDSGGDESAEAEAFREYAECLDKARPEDTEALQECADLLERR
jgi:hypothetical protein